MITNKLFPQWTETDTYKEARYKISILDKDSKEICNMTAPSIKEAFRIRGLYYSSKATKLFGIIIKIEKDYII